MCARESSCCGTVARTELPGATARQIGQGFSVATRVGFESSGGERKTRCEPPVRSRRLVLAAAAVPDLRGVPMIRSSHPKQSAWPTAGGSCAPGAPV